MVSTFAPAAATWFLPSWLPFTSDAAGIPGARGSDRRAPTGEFAWSAIPEGIPPCPQGSYGLPSLKKRLF
jgi:hypothetical protein